MTLRSRHWCGAIEECPTVGGLAVAGGLVGRGERVRGLPAICVFHLGDVSLGLCMGQGEAQGGLGLGLGLGCTEQGEAQGGGAPSCVDQAL